MHVVESADSQVELDLDTPRPLREMRVYVHDGGTYVEVRSGGYLITAYPKHDLGLRNLAIVTLANSHHSARYVADLFGLSEGQVSRIRSDYDEHGSAGLAKKRGHPPLLNNQQIRQARLWAGQDVRHAEIARRLNVSRSLIGGLLQDHPPLHPDQPLDGDWDTGEPTEESTGSDTTTSSLSVPAGIAEQPDESIEESTGSDTTSSVSLSVPAG